MKFEFKPSENNISFREYLDYLTLTLPGVTIYRQTILLPCLIAIFSMVTYILSDYYIGFTYILILIIIILLFYFLIIFLIIKVIKSKKKKVLKNNNLCYDLESTFYFTVEDGYLIRENEFSTIKLQFDKIKYIKLLKGGVILTTDNENVSIFIPKDILPVTLEEFISLLKNENNSIIVLEEFKKLKKSLKKINIILVITFILACISGFFVGKYSFTRYDLVMGNELIKQNDNTYLYENDTLGFSLTFPSTWEGKFGIEEREDGIDVYYLVNGKQSHYTTLLFSIRGLGVFFNNIDFNLIKNEGLYFFVGPSEIELRKDSKEHLEYLDLYKDIKNIKLRENTYYPTKIQ